MRIHPNLSEIAWTGSVIPKIVFQRIIFMILIYTMLFTIHRDLVNPRTAFAAISRSLNFARDLVDCGVLLNYKALEDKKINDFFTNASSYGKQFSSFFSALVKPHGRVRV